MTIYDFVTHCMGDENFNMSGIPTNEKEWLDAVGINYMTDDLGNIITTDENGAKFYDAMCTLMDLNRRLNNNNIKYNIMNYSRSTNKYYRSGIEGSIYIKGKISKESIIDALVHRNLIDSNEYDDYCVSGDIDFWDIYSTKTNPWTPLYRLEFAND